MSVDKTKEAVLISCFAQTKEENFPRPYEVGGVVRRQIREQLLYHHCPMKPGMEYKRRCCGTALAIPDLIVRRGKKLL
jgi:hypothetical protein